MSAPGWYPDPAGQPRRLRYWDGSNWTAKVTDSEAGPSGPASEKRGSRWLWIAAASVVAVAVAVTAIWVNSDRMQASDPVLTYSPTISAWNESETPTPTPTPTPSEPRPSTTRLRCDQTTSATDLGSDVSGGRLSVGNISMPAAPADWSGPWRQSMVIYGTAAYGYSKKIESHGLTTWSNTMLIGPTNFAEVTDLETQARTIIACLAGTDVMDRYLAPAKLQLKATKVSGHQAVQADAVYSWDDPELDTKGSLIRVIVVETSGGPFFFLGEATKERSDMVKVMNQLSAGLRAS